MSPLLDMFISIYVMDFVLWFYGYFIIACYYYYYYYFFSYYYEYFALFVVPKGGGKPKIYMCLCSFHFSLILDNNK